MNFRCLGSQVKILFLVCERLAELSGEKMMKCFYMKELALNTLPKDTQASLEPFNNLPFQEIL